MDKSKMCEYVKKAKNGDGDAFSVLYEDIYKGMYRYALYATSNKEDAEDALQNALIQIWKNLPQLETDSLFKSWAYKILQNECRHILKKNMKNPDTLPLEDCEFLLSSEDEMYSVDSQVLLDAIKGLTPPDGQLILMSVIGNFKSYELAEIFSMTPVAVRSRQSRAMKKLREILTEGEIK